MTDGTRKVVIPRNNPVNAITMAGIILDAGLSLDEFEGSYDGQVRDRAQASCHFVSVTPGLTEFDRPPQLGHRP